MNTRFHLASLLIKDTLNDMPDTLHNEFSDLIEKLDTYASTAADRLAANDRFATYKSHLLKRFIEITRGME